MYTWEEVQCREPTILMRPQSAHGPTSGQPTKTATVATHNMSYKLGLTLGTTLGQGYTTVGTPK